ncbi:MAG: RNA polymerase sigma factor [Thermoflexibacteraceae bacterium]
MQTSFLSLSLFYNTFADGMAAYDLVNTALIQEELAWVERAKRNPEHFHYLYEKYARVIFYFIFRRTNEAEIAEDLTSQTFLKALEKIHTFQDRGVPFSAWLYKIATNEVNLYYRKHQTNPVVSLEETFAHRLADDNPENITEESLQELANVLADLDSNDLLLLQLRFYEDKSFKEIAFILDIQEATAKMRLYRLLEKLKEKLKKNV